ncbi:MAG: glycosyltransferase [Prevotella sp.]|nr:glycosyltransferase [Prevotella sp.]
MKTKLAIVLPCYNEEEILPFSIEKLSQLFDQLIKKEVISDSSFMLFVNDGSNDNTWNIIKDYNTINKYVYGIKLSHNVGHQKAIMAGMMAARKMGDIDVVITMDADLQDDLEAISKMIDEYENGADIVYGVKIQRKVDPFFKRISAETFYKFMNKYGVETVFNHSDFRLLSNKALDILSQYDERNIYLRGLIPMIGLPSATVDDKINERIAGKSKYTFVRMMGLALDGITSFSVKPIYSVIYIGVIFLIVSLLIGISVIYAFATKSAVTGWASLILSIWLVGGFMMLGIGIVGVYIGKIYEEVKHRPLYHIVEMLK